MNHRSSIQGDDVGLVSWFRFGLTSAAALMEDASDRKVEMKIFNPVGAIDADGQVAELSVEDRITPDLALHGSEKVPMTASVGCKFRNLLVYTDPISTFTATQPTSAYTNAECTAGMDSVAVSYSFKPEFKDRISQQCLYLNGKLNQAYGAGNNGPGPDSAYQVDVDATMNVFVGSSPFESTAVRTSVATATHCRH
jgi:hypothetical protein